MSTEADSKSPLNDTGFRQMPLTTEGPALKRMDILRSSQGVAIALLQVTWCVGFACAEPLTLEESYTDDQVYRCQAKIDSQGKVFFIESEESEDQIPLTAEASFQFTERRLPPAGRDALAFRSVRHFQHAQMKTTVDTHVTQVRLPQPAALIVSEGYREGVRHYSPQTKLDRDSLDLLGIPGDPLVLAALLPAQPVEVDESWKPSDWVMQLLTGIEAVESTELNCQLTAANSISAKITFSGKIEGQRFGAQTKVDVKGTLIFDLRTSHVARTQAIYTIRSKVGTIEPGQDVVVTSNLIREVADQPGVLTRELAETVPLDPAAEQLELMYRVPEWGVELEHGREWHLFNAVTAGEGQVAILRLIENGSLICQCNVSPMLKAAPGQLVPIDQFESDIQQSLGDNFKAVKESDTLDLPDGRRAHRVLVDGQREVRGDKGAAIIPMTWLYYLVVDPGGRQLSMMFAVETPLVEQLGDRDRQLVEQQRFVGK